MKSKSPQESSGFDTLLQRTRSKVEEDHSELKDELEEFVKSFPKLSGLDEILEFLLEVSNTSRALPSNGLALNELQV